MYAFVILLLKPVSVRMYVQEPAINKRRDEGAGRSKQEAQRVRGAHSLLPATTGALV